MAEIRNYNLSVSDYPVCDFCSAPDPLWLEDAEDFDVYFAILDNGDQEIGTSKGSWASCAVCHELVRTKKWHTLERRAVDALSAKHPELPRSKVAEGVRTMHAKFQQHRSPA